MPKKIMQDIVVKKKRTSKSAVSPQLEKRVAHESTSGAPYIEDFLPPVSNQEKKKELAMEDSPIFEKMRQRHEERESFSDEYASDRSHGFRRYLKKTGVVVFIFAVLVLFIFGMFFHSASVKISLKHVDVPLDNTEFLASVDNPETIPFQVMSISEEQYVDLVPTGEKEVSIKASGTITIYNEYSSKSQILIKNTRFQSPDGKIYRIDKQVVVPGTITIAGKQTPGTVDALVSADASGPDYNTDSARMTIPGFKGTPRYTKFYAKTKTAISGGAKGVQKVVSDEDMRQARETLSSSLTQKLLERALAEHPKGTVLFPNAVFYTFSESTQNSGNSVKFNIKGTIQSVLFDSFALGRKIAEDPRGVEKIDDEVEIQNIKDLTFAWKKPTSSAPDPTETISFLLSGNARAVWAFDAETLKAKLAGQKKTEFNELLKTFSGVSRGTPVISPFWKNFFPENPDKIYIETSID